MDAPSNDKLADQFIVVSVRADPEPIHPTVNVVSQDTISVPDAGGPEGANFLKVQ